MGDKPVTRFRVVEDANPSPHQSVGDITFVDDDGEAIHFLTDEDSVAAVGPFVTATAIGIAAKVLTDALPASNTLVLVKFTSGNSAASITLAFATGGAKTVLLGGAAPGAGEVTIAANGVAMFFWDGTNFHQIGVYS